MWDQTFDNKDNDNKDNKKRKILGPNLSLLFAIVAWGALKYIFSFD